MSHTVVLTHRGLQPSTSHFFAESSFEAFQNQIENGFGLEFDFNLTADDKIVIFHDSSLARTNSNSDKRMISSLLSAEIKKLSLGNDHFCFFDRLIPLLEESKAPLHALHFKGKFQQPKYMGALIEALYRRKNLQSKILLFDLRPQTARFLKQQLPSVHLAASVAHPYDIERYGNVVDNTLLTIDDALKNQDLFEWVWLDEWDRLDRKSDKKLYTPENFQVLRKHDFHIALVTPDLHATSPGLLGGEAHSDAATKEQLFERIKEILTLKPDAVCTDFPYEVQSMAFSNG